MRISTNPWGDVLKKIRAFLEFPSTFSCVQGCVRGRFNENWKVELTILRMSTKLEWRGDAYRTMIDIGSVGLASAFVLILFVNNHCWDIEINAFELDDMVLNLFQ